ncbi:MAG: hypothetical protein IJN92_11445 [Lachnospiraceae bacterium]|nr:hypothetical protein [Lachnospiraceae bacterium]
MKNKNRGSAKEASIVILPLFCSISEFLEKKVPRDALFGNKVDLFGLVRRAKPFVIFDSFLMFDMILFTNMEFSKKNTP